MMEEVTNADPKNNPRPAAAHFLLWPELAESPPNEALVSALLELGYRVDLFSPPPAPKLDEYGPNISWYPVEYRSRWLARNLLSSKWRRYRVYSGTTEVPMAVAGALAARARRPSFTLADEIHAGSYPSKGPRGWGRLGRRAMRRGLLTIVNDSARVDLQRAYAGLKDQHPIVVYPGCFREPPEPGERARLRKEWGFPENALVLAFSGHFGQLAGADFLLEALERRPSLHVLLQPLGVNPLTLHLLQSLATALDGRLTVADERLSWRESWSSMAGVDIGTALYLNSAPQFQAMGTSSNRLCMSLAMGIPVIASRQESFRFLEEFECGILVDSAEEFIAAIDAIAQNLDAMKRNARRCATEYIRAPQRYIELMEALRTNLGYPGA